MPNRLALLLIALLSAGVAVAQPARLSGTVVAADGLVGVPGATIEATHEAGFNVTTASGADGSYVFARLLPGAYRIVTTHPGFAARVTELTLAPGEAGTRQIVLAPAPILAGEVDVDGSRDASSEVSDGRRLGAQALLPPGGLLPGPDVARALETLPSFTLSGDGSGGLTVRGGEPTHNLFLVEGIPILRPLHVLGGLSVVPGEAVAHVDAYAGAFPAHYGGRMASVVDVTLRKPSRKPVGTIDVAPLLSGFALQSVVAPDVTALVAARRSFVGEVGSGITGGAQPFGFWDALGHIDASLTPTATLRITGLASGDEGSLGPSRGANEVTWENAGAGLRLRYLPPGQALLTDVHIYGSRMRSTSQTDVSDADFYGGSFGLRYLFDRATFAMGMQAQTGRFAASLAPVGAVRGEEVEEFMTEATVFVELGVTRGAFEVTPGMRLSAFPSRGQTLGAPTIQAKWGRGAHAIDASAGVAYQAIGARYGLRRPGDPFTAWVPSLDDAPVPRAQTASLGWSYAAPLLEARLEGYVRRMDHLTPGTPGRPPSADSETQGHSRGLEASLRVPVRLPIGDVTAALNGAWSRTRYREPDLAYDAPTDQPLAGALRLTWQRGPLGVGLVWQGGSGRPFTRVRGFYRGVDADPLNPSRLATDAGQIVAIAAPPGATRLPAHHRMDVSARYTREIGRASIQAFVGIENLYDRANLFAYDVATRSRRDVLPRTLTVGFRLSAR